MTSDPGCAVTAEEFDPADIAVRGEGFFLAGAAGVVDFLHDQLSAMTLYGVTHGIAAAIDAGWIFSAHDSVPFCEIIPKGILPRVCNTIPAIY